MLNTPLCRADLYLFIELLIVVRRQFLRARWLIEFRVLRVLKKF